MSVTPNGSPAWVRSASHEDYGGHTSKQNWHGVGVTNPRTDVGAEAVARLASDVAAVVRTSPFVWITYTCNDSSPAAPTIESVNLMTGVRFTSYAGDAAPTGFPSAARNGNGDVTFTFPASPEDEYGVAGNVVIKGAVPSLAMSTAGDVTFEIPTDNTLRVRAFDSAGAALSNARVSICVVTGS